MLCGGLILMPLHQAPPSKNELARSCKIVQESCVQDLLGMCTRYVPFLAQSCTYLARNGARFCKRCCKNNYLQVWSFLHILLQELVQDCARIVQEKGHIGCTCQASLACKILAQSCMILTMFVFAGLNL